MIKKIFLTILFLLICYFGYSQHVTLNKYQSDFGTLIEKNNLINVKSGMLLTAIRSDTLFVIQYFQKDNALVLFPIAQLDSINKTFIQGDSEYFEQESGLLSSKYINSVVENSDTTYVIDQNMICPNHKIISNSTELNNDSLGRMFFYSKSKGIHKVNYYDNQLKDCIEMNWYYKEGDFYNFLWVNTK